MQQRLIRIGLGWRVVLALQLLNLSVQLAGPGSRLGQDIATPNDAIDSLCELVLEAEFSQFDYQEATNPADEDEDEVLAWVFLAPNRIALEEWVQAPVVHPLHYPTPTPSEPQGFDVPPPKV